MNSHDYFLNRCIELAKQAHGKVSPNPYVGCVIVENGEIIAEGFHSQHGSVHAEIDALNKLIDHDLKNATLYVNLEPCSHQSKTKINPPCAPAIINAGIKSVVISMKDPNPHVNGQGIKILKENGVNVQLVDSEESKYLNRFFCINQIQNKAFITLKIAQSMNAKTSRGPGKNPWITDDDARKVVQQMRHEHDAILVSSNTIINDNPELTIRYFKAINPIRIVLDTHLKTNPKSHVYTDKKAKTLLFTTKSNHDAYKSDYCDVIVIEDKNNLLDLKQVFKEIYKRKINSIFVEAGPVLSSALISENLVDELLLFIAPKILDFGKSTFDELILKDEKDFISFESITTELINDQLLVKGLLTKCLRDL